jgi:hypothetical protein
MKQRIDITDECKAKSRERVMNYLYGCAVHGTPFTDAREVVEDWIAEERQRATELEEENKRLKEKVYSQECVIDDYSGRHR